MKNQPKFHEVVIVWIVAALFAVMLIPCSIAFYFSKEARHGDQRNA